MPYEANTGDSDTEELRQYVREHRDDLIYAIKHGDPSVQTLAIAALVNGGEPDLEIAKREIEHELENL